MTDRATDRATDRSLALDGAGLFSGPQSLRVAGEMRALWMCMLAAPLVIALASIVFHSLSLWEFVLLAVGGMVFVSMGRGRLLGSSIRIHRRQLPAIDALVTTIAARLSSDEHDLNASARSLPYANVSGARTAYQSSLGKYRSCARQRTKIALFMNRLYFELK